MLARLSRRHLARIVSVAITAVGISSIGINTPANAADPTCGNVPSPSAVFTECDFYDDFTGTVLNPNALNGSNWRKINSTATNKAFTGGNCFRNGQVAVGSGQLHLISEVLETPIKCWGFGNGAVYTRLLGASVTTDTKYTSKYGRIEFRAQLPVNDALSWTTFWMSPDKRTYSLNEDNIWPYNGEIDIMERLPWAPNVWPWPQNTIHTSLHYADKSGAIDRNSGDENPGETLYSCTMPTPQDWHTYSAEWTTTQVPSPGGGTSPNLVRFFIDDVQCASLGWDPANVTPPAPFDQPFNLIASHIGVGNAATPAAGSTRETKIDWVKVWGLPD